MSKKNVISISINKKPECLVALKILFQSHCPSTNNNQKGRKAMARTGENIYKRKDGRWEARYIASYDGNGKAQYKYLYAHTYTEVKAKLLKAQNYAHLASEVKKENDIGKYEYWLDEWLRAKRLSVKESTYIRYRNTIENHIKPDLGKYAICKISTSLMEQFVSHKLQNGRIDGNGGLSPKSMSDILTIVKESFKYAQSYGAIVLCSFDRISFKKNAQEMRVLSLLEEQRLLSVLFKDFDRYKLGVFICLYTGIRIGELCALQWKNISFSENTIKIEHTMQRLQIEDINAIQKTRIIVSEPKSYAALRTIPLPEFVIDVIKPFASSSNAYVLSGTCKTLIEPRTMQNRFKTYLEEGAIEDANFHALRHTFATRCIEAGFDVKTLSEILGHSSVKITLDKYVHSSMQLKRINMDKLKLATV